MSVTITNLQRALNINKSLLKSQAIILRNNYAHPNNSLTIYLTTNRHIKRLNHKFAATPSITDVLSFRQADPPSPHLPHSPSPDTSPLPNLSLLRDAPYLDPRTGRVVPQSHHHHQHVEQASRHLGNVFLSLKFCHDRAVSRQIRLCDYLLLAVAHAIAHLAAFDHITSYDYQHMKRAEQSAIQQVLTTVGRGHCDYNRSGTPIRTDPQWDVKLPSSYLP